MDPSYRDALLIELAEANAAKKDSEERWRELQKEYIDEVGEDHAVLLEGGTKLAGKIIRSVVIEPNSEALRMALDDDQWAAVTRTVVDRDLLEDAVSRGIIDPVVAGSCLDEKPRSPYVRIVRK